MKLAKASQAVLLSSYHLCSQLADVYEAVGRFAKQATELMPRDNAAVVDFVVQPVVGDADVLRKWIDRLVQVSTDRARVILVVDAKHARWYEQIVSDAVRIVPVAGSLGRILAPCELFEHAAPYLSSPKVTFLFGIEEFFIDTFLLACCQAGSHPASRVGHVLFHYDDKENKYYDYARGAGELASLHDAALGCVIFDRDWLSRSIPVRDLSWKDVCRIAELQSMSVVDCPATSVIIDITAYERNTHRVTSRPRGVLDPTTLSRLASPIRETLSSNATVVTCLPWTSTASSNAVSDDTLFTTVLGMEPHKRWKLLLLLYHSVPMPRLLRRTITLIRKCVGIR